MTTAYKRNVNGVIDTYAALDVMKNPEFIKSLPHARENFDQPHMYVGYDDQGRQWINGRKGAPSWDEVIEAYMTIPVVDVLHHAGIVSTYGPRRFWSREEAESKAARLYPDLVPQRSPDNVETNK